MAQIRHPKGGATSPMRDVVGSKDISASTPNVTHANAVVIERGRPVMIHSYIKTTRERYRAFLILQSRSSHTIQRRFFERGLRVMLRCRSSYWDANMKSRTKYSAPNGHCILILLSFDNFFILFKQEKVWYIDAMSFEQMAAACRFIITCMGDNGWFSNLNIQIFADSKSPFLSVSTPYKTYLEVDSLGKFTICDPEQVKLVPEVIWLLERCIDNNPVR